MPVGDDAPACRADDAWRSMGFRTDGPIRSTYPPLSNGRKCRVRAARRVPSGGQRSVRGADGAAVGTGPRPVPTSAGSATRAEDPGPGASRRPAGARGRRPPDDHPVFRADDRRRSASPSCPGHAGRCSGGRGPNARGPDIVLAGPGPTRTSCGIRLQGRTAFHGGPAPGRHRTGFGVLAGTGPPDGGGRGSPAGPHAPSGIGT